MEILNALKKLRDDIKTWVTNNLITLNTKVDNKIDKEEGKGLSANDFTNEYKNKLDTLNGSQSVPNISEDEFGNLLIKDFNDNIILRSNDSEIEITNLAVENITINGKSIQEVIKAYVDEAILGGAW